MWPFAPAYPEASLSQVAGREYDYIIVGGGTAGCALASRLSESDGISVLVLERGAVNDTLMTRIPLVSCTLDPIPYSVIRTSEPNPGCDGRKIQLTHSESLGGNTRINGMLFTRGMPAMYDQWEAKTGFKTWNWEGISHYFDRIQGAMIETTQHPPQFDLCNHVQKAAKELGLPFEGDMNRAGAPSSAFMNLHYTIDAQGNRHSAMRSYLPASVANERRHRLTVCTGVVAKKLEVENRGQRIAGVQIKTAGAPEEGFVRAKREVIICTGATRSPQLLQLSGIGPKELLAKHNIPLLRDLPVGIGFNDHYAFPVLMEVPVEQTFHFMEKNPMSGAWQMIKWLTSSAGLGFLRSPSMQTAVYVDTKQVNPKTQQYLKGERDDGIPDIECMVIPANAAVGSFKGKFLVSLFTCLLQPKSVGQVEIGSLDPEEDPKLFTNIFSDPEDLVTARRGVRFALAMAENIIETMAPTASLFLPSDPQTAAKDNQELHLQFSDDELDHFVKTRVCPVMHNASSNPMGREEDGGVVGEDLRVHGFSNLRIADASVFPIIPATHTMAPTYLVAERCADLIKETWK